MAKKSRKPTPPGGNTPSGNSNDFTPSRELVVIVKPETKLQVRGTSVTAAEAINTTALANMLEKEDCNMVPLFGLSEEKMRSKIASMSSEIGESMDDLSTFYHVEAADEQLESLAKEFGKLDIVEAAYVKPAAELANVETLEMEDINTMTPSLEAVPAVTPNFTPRQVYLNPAPAGIDAYYAWTIPGGRGAGVKIIDVEWGWNFTHEDLVQNQMGVVAGVNSTSTRFVNHGTAVAGEIGGDRNNFGVTGICSDAQFGGSSLVTLQTSQAIRQAADKLNKGDIILLEVQRTGPAGRYIAIEWWPDDFAAIRYAVNKGIIVVEAAGNGNVNLDAAIYNTKPAGFPAWWKNPFNPAHPSSHAVVVGAGAPPPGTHGVNIYGPDRSRLSFSNYGKRVDCQGYGRLVTSTGYGDLQGGPQNEWYTDTFSGTSSASPIVVGALGCIQGILRNQGSSLLTSPQAIQHLRATGSPQQAAPGRPVSQRIGNRPNLRQLVAAVANRWFVNRTVIRTYSSTSSKDAWAILNGGSWMRIRNNSTDGETNVLMLLNMARANNRPIDVYIRNGEIEQVILK